MNSPETIQAAAELAGGFEAAGLEADVIIEADDTIRVNMSDEQVDALEDFLLRGAQAAEDAGDHEAACDLRGAIKGYMALLRAGDN